MEAEHATTLRGLAIQLAQADHHREAKALLVEVSLMIKSLHPVSRMYISHRSNNLLTLDLKLKNKYRKPNSGMLRLARSLNCGDNCLYVGNRPEDEAAAQGAGIPFLAADVSRSLPGFSPSAIAARKI